MVAAVAIALVSRASFAIASTPELPPVPESLRGEWAQMGRCDLEHLHIADRSMAIGGGEAAPVFYVPAGVARNSPGLSISSQHQEIHWLDRARSDFLLYDPVGSALVHESSDKPPPRWPGWKDVYQRCRDRPRPHGD